MRSKRRSGGAFPVTGSRPRSEGCCRPRVALPLPFGFERLTIPLALALACLAGPGPAGAQAAPTSAPRVVVLTVEGTVQFSGAGAARWDPAYANQVLNPGDRIRTREHSRATLRLPDRSIIRMGEFTDFEIQPSQPQGRSVGHTLWQGIIRFFHRGPAVDGSIRTRTASAAVRGTEFTLAVLESGRTVLTMLEGEAVLSNAAGETAVAGREQAIAEPGQAPFRAVVIDVVNVLQWCLYYPGILDVTELNLAEGERRELRDSLEAYRQGDLQRALLLYPDGRQAQTPEERLYRAGLLLVSGNVLECEQMLDSLPPGAEGGALRRLIGAVRHEELTEALARPELASEWLAESYYQQSRGNLAEAREAARRAVEVSREFGFAWARLGELEFSFGQWGKAAAALERSLLFSPRNPQALALKGFLLAGENRVRAARTWFEMAREVDGALGNAWLGQGLCRIRQGDVEGGVADLQTAAALEPDRALFRSYLGKAFHHNHELGLAETELELAEFLDPADPTSWLYSALLKRDQNELNEAIGDLERSIGLNDNRQLYRSRFFLDQDRAVRSANLAALYQWAGMTNVGVREAARAVNSDYANHSAHLFFAESYNALRDPTRFNLRYETVWFNELLLAHLLAPVGAGTLSQNLTPQEYSRLFEADGLRLSSETQYRSDGQIQQLASQSGRFGNSAYALDLDYQHNQGVRANNELSRLEWYTRFKQQLTPQDSVFLLFKYHDYEAGDNFQYSLFQPDPDPASNARKDFSVEERQAPLAVAGYHREWSPGMHTLFLGGRLESRQWISDREADQWLLYRNLDGSLALVDALPFDVDYQSEFEIYTAELNQILQRDRHTLVLGARYQSGQFTTHNRFLTIYPPFLMAPPTEFWEAATDGFERVSGYGYYTLGLGENLRLTAGLSYDRVVYPVNFRNPPVLGGEESRDRLNPKAALVWSPVSQLTVRAAYTRSLGGVSFDESYRLEPTQLAGFVQSFRTLISESLVGSVSVPEHETAGLAFDWKLTSRTYIGLQGEYLQSGVDRQIGLFEWVNLTPPVEPVRTREELDYDEVSALVAIDQLLSDRWSVGAGYSFTRSELDRAYPGIPKPTAGAPDTEQRSDLHRVQLRLLYNHPCGFFAGSNAGWYFQNNSLREHSSFTEPSVHRTVNVDFPRVDLYAGYRFPRRRGDLTAGVVNLIGDDYLLDPLNVHPEMARERVFMARLRLSF